MLLPWLGFDHNLIRHLGWLFFSSNNAKLFHLEWLNCIGYRSKYHGIRTSDSENNGLSRANDS